MKDEVTINTLRALRTRADLDAYATRLGDWLRRTEDGDVLGFGESRAKALLRAANLADDATLGDFAQLMERDPSVRVALYDLLQDTGLYEEAEVRELAQLSASGDPQPVRWLALIIAGYAWRGGYPLAGLDPAAPPSPNTPAGQSLRRTAHFVRRQVQRSATERDKLDRILSRPPSGAPTLNELDADQQPIAPLPPHFRPPIPERYPEMADETLQVSAEEAVSQPTITVGDPLVISAEDVGGESSNSGDPVRMPPITIEPEQVAANANAAPAANPPSPMPTSAVVMPTATTNTPSRPGLTVSLRQMFRQEELTSTKLRVLVQHYPDGPGLYGLQVRVSCKGIKSYVAGTTDRDGKFICELPVRMQSGLTYDVDVTWPREEGGETERKSITLHADRTHFVLPFYRRLNPAEDE